MSFNLIIKEEICGKGHGLEYINCMKTSNLLSIVRDLFAEYFLLFVDIVILTSNF